MGIPICFSSRRQTLLPHIEKVLVFSFALDVSQSEGKSSQAASSPTVLDVAKVHLNYNSPLRMSIPASTFCIHHRNGTHQLMTQTHPQWRKPTAAIATQDKRTQYDCSSWLLIVSPETLNVKNKIQWEISIGIVQNAYFVLQTCFKMENSSKCICKYMYVKT